MRRQCARSGCSAPATATFTFDARERTVWLDVPADGAARAGELCERHARVLTPPQGWQLDDRRASPSPNDSLERLPALGAAAASPPPITVPTNNLSDLRRALDAHTPMLARAFEAAGRV